MPTKTKKASKEIRTFSADDNLILHVIKKQAGTLSKAALEGVQNSIDAGATIIKLTVGATQLRLEDNGSGFKSADDVKRVFEVFGLAHEMDDLGNSTDAKYGKYRIGRGQLFAFGRNVWRTNEHRMTVDVDNDGLNYTLETDLDTQEGCVVEVDLYEPLTLRDVQNTIDQITRFCRYVPETLIVNGQDISQDPAKLKWDLVTEDAYVNKKVIEERWRGSGLDVYQQGVFVENLPSHQFGLEGTVVIRKEVSVNFARNQIISSCPQWKRVKQMLTLEGANDAKQKKTKLTAFEARNYLTQFANGEVHYNDMSVVSCLADTNGKMWSLKRLKGLLNSRAKKPALILSPVGNIRIGFAPGGCRVSDRVMQRRMALVLDENLLEYLRADGSNREEKAANAVAILRAGLPQLNGYDRFAGRLEYVDQEGMKNLLEDDADNDYDLLDLDQLTPRERIYLDILQGASRDLIRMFYGSWQESRNDMRRVCIGTSALADGWTDGRTYIAINRKYISRLNLGYERDWCKLCLLLAHEVCHTDSDMSSHVHGLEFFQSYHDLSDCTPDVARTMFSNYRNTLIRKLKKNKLALKELHSEAEKYAAHIVSGERDYDPSLNKE